MTLLILNYKAKRSLKNTSSDKRNKQALLDHVRENTEVPYYSISIEK